MMKFVNKLVAAFVLFVLAMCIIAPAAGEHYSIGNDFKIDFNMGGTVFKTDIPSPKTIESLSGVEITYYYVNVTDTSGHKASIQLEEKQQGTGLASQEVSDRAYKLGYVVEETSVRDIDGVKGNIAKISKAGAISYMAMYQQSWGRERFTVTIISTFPWDSGTTALLNSIHIS